jgi:hypothetical protein
MLPLTDKIQSSEFKSVKNLARHLDMHPCILFAFNARRYNKISRANHKFLLTFYRSQGWLPTPKPRPRCTCDHCGKVHVASRAYREARRKSVLNYFQSLNFSSQDVIEQLDEITKEFIDLANMHLPVFVHAAVKEARVEGFVSPSTDPFKEIGNGI